MLSARLRAVSKLTPWVGLASDASYNHATFSAKFDSTALVLLCAIFKSKTLWGFDPRAFLIEAKMVFIQS